MQHGSSPDDASLQTAITWPAPEAFFDISRLVQISNGWAQCTAVALCDSNSQPRHTFEQGEHAHFFYEFELTQDIEVPIAGIVLQNERGVIVHGKGTLEYGTAVPSTVPAGNRVRVAQAIRLDLAVGDYTFEVGLATMKEDDHSEAARLVHAELGARIVRLCHLPAAGRFTVTFRTAGRPVQLLHHGVADLPGESTVAVVPGWPEHNPA